MKSLASVRNAFHFRPGELKMVLWSFLYFFCLLTSYYMLRPIREQMGVAAGVKNLQWLFTGTLLVMLLVQPIYGKIVSSYPRKVFLPFIYLFFASNIVLFYFLFSRYDQNVILARVFFIWVSVFNLFIVSVFWSYMADIYDKEQGKRLFGLIAAGGSVGAITGPLLTVMLVKELGSSRLMLVSAGFLLFCIVCIFALRRYAGRSRVNPEAPMGGNVLEGLQLVLKSRYLQYIALITFFATLTGTFLYFMQAILVDRFFHDPHEQTRVFAQIDLATNSLTLIFQLIVTPILLTRWRFAIVLALIPMAMSVGFTALALVPVFTVMAVVQVIRRSGAYGILNPSMNVLYTAVDERTKYKAKNFIDTVIYRTGDTASGWIYHTLSLFMSFPALAMLGAGISLVWTRVAWQLGLMSEKKHAHHEDISDTLL